MSSSCNQLPNVPSHPEQSAAMNINTDSVIGPPVPASQAAENAPTHVVQPVSVPQRNESNQRVRYAHDRRRRQANTQNVETSDPVPIYEFGIDPDAASEIKYYSEQLYRLLKPVIACIWLSILWTKISLSGSDFRPAQSAWSVFDESSANSASEQFLGSLANAGIVIAQIIVMTVIIVILFKYGYFKILFGFFGIVVVFILGFTGYVLLLSILQVWVIPIDYITLVFGLYNFAVVGLINVFWHGPLVTQQVYLVLMSSLMAFVLTGIQEWTTWILLGLLAIWDLFAVLTPCGPLRILVESSRQQDQEIPALLYSVGTMVWFMATPQLSTSATSLPNSNSSSNSSFPPRTQSLIVSSHNRNTIQEGNLANRNNGSAANGNPYSDNIPLIDNANINLTTTARSSEPLIGVPGPGQSSRSRDAVPGGRQADAETSREEDIEVDDEDSESSGLKLGLGDFVFYSVLIGRASMTDWVTTSACFVAVMTGMTLTIFLLAIFQRALPALPISIAFGILFYFVVNIVVTPFLKEMLQAGLII